jgi:phage baseplate assembly protein W
MSIFERALPTFRLVETRWGDDLQAVAARELGDANRWIELVWINSLVHPYITTDDRLVAPGVIKAGALLKVPAPVGFTGSPAEQGQVYERDAQLVGKKLQADADGDLAVVSGVDNLRQQLGHRVDTPRGQARRHPDYGNLLWRLLGTVNGPVAAALGAKFIRSCLKSDYRVLRVTSATAEVEGDVVRTTASVEAIQGGVIDVVNQQ